MDPWKLLSELSDLVICTFKALDEFFLSSRLELVEGSEIYFRQMILIMKVDFINPYYT